jgi:hypothetical protein
MMSKRTLLVASAVISAFAVLAAACSSPKPSPSSSSSSSLSAPQLPAPVGPQALWGDLTPVVSVKELMRDMLDPASDDIFDAVKIVQTRKGTVDVLPKTEEDWDRIRIGAVTLAEGVSLLKIKRPFAPPGDVNNSTGPDPEEISPAQIEAKIEKDPVLWNAKIEALRNVGLEVMEIVKTRKTDQLWQASDDLDSACETCHVTYWYPGEGALFKRLDRRLEELYGQPGLRPDRSGRGPAKP